MDSGIGSIEDQARKLFSHKWRDRQVLVMKHGAGAQPGAKQGSVADRVLLSTNKSTRIAEGLARGAAAYVTLGLSEVALAVGSKKVRDGYMGELKKLGIGAQGAKGGSAHMPSVISCSPDLIDYAVDTGWLREPSGGFLYDTAYAGHPYQPAIYEPVADFHRFLFEDKAAELSSILAALGARWYTVTHVSRMQHGGRLGVGLSLELLALRGKSAAQTTTSGSVSWEVTLEPRRAPYVPADLVWCPTEPSWQHVIMQRLQTEATNFRVELKYQKDYQINRDVAVGLEALGLDLGGKFVDYEEVVWQVEGEYVPKRTLGGTVA